MPEEHFPIHKIVEVNFPLCFQKGTVFLCHPGEQKQSMPDISATKGSSVLPLCSASTGTAECRGRNKSLPQFPSAYVLESKASKFKFYCNDIY